MQSGKSARKIFSLFCLLFIPITSFGQIKNDKKLASIPPQLRERFIERLNLYFELKRTQQFEKLYDLLSEVGDSAKPTRDEFIKMHQESKDFIRNAISYTLILDGVKKVSRGRYDTYYIQVYVTCQYQKEKSTNPAYFEAQVENGDWYFREHYVEI